MPESEGLLLSGEPASGAEKLFVVLALLLSTGAFLNLWIERGQAPNLAASAIGLLVTGLMYLIALSLLVRHCKGFLLIFLREWPLAALAGIAMASAFWSQAPTISLRHGVALLFTFLFGLYLTMRYSFKDQLRMLAWVCGICVVSSFIFGLLGLGTSVDAGYGVSGWYGVFTQKNALGQIMGLSALVFLFWKRAEPKHGRLASIGFLASLALIALSRSMTAIVIIALLLVIMPYLQWTARKSVQWIVAGFVFLAGVGIATLLYVATHLSEVTGSLGKSVTLTGRLQLWIFSAAMALRRPWLGYGYEAFWFQDQGATARIWHALGWNAPNAHNGFLEIWLELGLCGLGIFAVGFSYYLWRSMKFLIRVQLPESSWPFIYLTFVFLLNITEVTLLYRNSILVILYSSAVLSTSASPFRAREPLVVAAQVRKSASTF